MIIFPIIIIWFNILGYHEFGLIEACGDLDQEDFIVKFDDEQVAHVDFIEQKDIITLPDFAGQIDLPPLYADARRAVSICKNFAGVLKEVYANSSVPLGKT